MNAERILRNARVLALDARSCVASAIAIRGERILALGAQAEVAALAGPSTEVIDLRGRTVMPGLIDGHAHMDREGLKALLPSLAGARSIADLVARLREIAAGVPAGHWIVTLPLGDPPEYRSSPSMYAEGRLPDRRDLDRASSDHPILIRSAWGYWSRQAPLVCVANSRALALAGITRGSEAPSPKVSIERDAAGEPSGVILESDFMPIAEFTLFRNAPNFTLDDRVRALQRSMQVYSAFGTTGVFEGHGAAPQVVSAYQRLRETGRQGVRAHLVFSPGWSGLSQDDVRAVLGSWGRWLAGRGLGDRRLRVAGVYTEIDETPESRLRARCAPQTGWAGFCYDCGLPRKAVKELMLEAARLGIRVCGIWENLFELYAEVDREIPLAGRRWVLGHQTFLDADRIARIRDMGLVLTTHTQIHKRGEEFLARAGPGREQTIYPLRALLDAGVTVSLGTDNVPPSLWHSVWEVTARRAKSGAEVAPAQRITREEALRCATVSGAYLCWEEDERGSLEPGKLADLAVFDEDPLTVDAQRLRSLESVMTLVGGRTVHTRLTS
ncbi:MAG: amidohydrolase [Burkholderiales bacterium]|nr:amidohydrolase [Burkholderiales bacterium]